MTDARISHRSGGARAAITGHRAVAVLTALALLGVGASSASAEAGLSITVNGAAAPFIDSTEIAQDADLPRSPASSGYPSLSTKLAVELEGVAPQTLMTMTINDNAGDHPVTLTEPQVVDGTGSPPQLGGFFVNGPPAHTYYYDASGKDLGTNDGDGDAGLPMSVDLAVTGTVLGVPSQLTAAPLNQGVGRQVQFDDSGEVTVDRFSATPQDDTNSVMYSWDFGDGTTSPPSSSPVASHAYAAVGSYSARLVATDAADNAGISPQAVDVQVVKDTQTISFPQLGPFSFGQPPVVLSASASSGLPVSYTRVSGPCSLDGSRLTFTGSGSCVLAADQPGNASTDPAPTVTSTIEVDPSPPTCSDQSLSTANATAASGTVSCVAASGDSGDALTYAAVTKPAHGTLSGPDPMTGAFTYTPIGTYAGPDSFTFDATDGQGSSDPATVSFTVAQAPAPSNATPPSASGSAQVGQTLTCFPGVWSGGMPQTFTYQWTRDGGAIPGATGATYAIVAADARHSLACAVTATNTGGSATATSAGVAIPSSVPVVTAPASTGRPGISGTATLGHVLTCSTGAWSGTAPLTYAYQWKRIGVPIAKATGATYALTVGDAGQTLACSVMASNAAGSASAQSPVVAVPFPSNVFTLAAPKAAKSGSITFRLHAPDAGRFAVLVTFSAAKAAAASGAKARVATYAKGVLAAGGAGARTLTIRPTKVALSALGKQRRLRLTVTVTFTPTGGKARSRTATLVVTAERN